MSNANLYSLFSAHFPNDPGAVFLEMPDGRRLHYADVPAMTGRMLSLLQQYGVEKGDRVVVQVDKSIEAIVLYLACLRAGAIYIPLNTAYTANEVAYFLQDAEPRVFVCTPQAKASLEGVAATAGVARIVSLGQAGDGELMAALAAQPAQRKGCPGGWRRPGGDSLHIRYDGTLERRDAQPCQPRVECAGAPRLLAVATD